MTAPSPGRICIVFFVAEAMISEALRRSTKTYSGMFLQVPVDLSCVGQVPDLTTGWE